jgi:hypothetical protein
MAHDTYQAGRATKPEPKYFTPPEASETRTIHDVPEFPDAPATVFAERRVASGDWFHRAKGINGHWTSSVSQRRCVSRGRSIAHKRVGGILERFSHA